MAEGRGRRHRWAGRLALALALSCSGGCGLRPLRGQPLFGALSVQVEPLAEPTFSQLAEPLAAALRRRLARAGLQAGAAGGASLSGEVTWRLQEPAGSSATLARIGHAQLRAQLHDAAGRLCWQDTLSAEEALLPSRGPWAPMVDEQAHLSASARLVEQLADATWMALRTAGGDRR